MSKMKPAGAAVGSTFEITQPTLGQPVQVNGAGKVVVTVTTNDPANVKFVARSYGIPNTGVIDTVTLTLPGGGTFSGSIGVGATHATKTTRR